MLEAAAEDEVVLITDNIKDFGDKSNPGQVAPALAEDLRAAGVDPERVSICRYVFDFNQRYVPAALAAKLMADEVNRETLKTEIADSVSWFPLAIGPDWKLGVPIDEGTLAGFDADLIELVRADSAANGYFMTVSATGTARLDLGIWKYDAVDIPDDSPVSVYDWDWNESMVAADTEVPARLLVEILVEDGNFSVSIEDVEPT